MWWYGGIAVGLVVGVNLVKCVREITLSAVLDKLWEQQEECPLCGQKKGHKKLCFIAQDWPNGKSDQDDMCDIDENDLVMN